MSTQKHDSGVRRSELGVSGERRVWKVRLKESFIGVGELDILNGSVQEKLNPGL